MGEYEFLRISDVVKLVKVNRSTIWRWAKAGKFPKSIRLGDNTTGWKREDLENWFKDRIKLRGV